ncbi:MAG: hypothetical protein IPI73_14575 [Betaproteobacteria bacterium]|nr:hypothetical protein [Betaproteobacteria bacterium]
MRAIILLLAAALCCGSARAAVPHEINYQGYLTDPGGAPVNATVQMVFSLYDTATGGTALHSETQSVAVANGVFGVRIGAQPGQPLALPFDIPYWLGVTVEADAEMAPRQALAAAPYAIRAASAETATRLETSRAINGVPFDGTADIARPDFACAAGTFITGFSAGNPVCSALPDIIFLQGFATLIQSFTSLDLDTAGFNNDFTNTTLGGEAGYDGFAVFAPLVLHAAVGVPKKSDCLAVPIYPPRDNFNFPPFVPTNFYCVKTDQGRYGYVQIASATPAAVTINWTLWQ